MRLLRSHRVAKTSTHDWCAAVYIRPAQRRRQAHVQQLVHPPVTGIPCFLPAAPGADYSGPSVALARALADSAHGGQVLMTEEAWQGVQDMLQVGGWGGFSTCVQSLTPCVLLALSYRPAALVVAYKLDRTLLACDWRVLPAFAGVPQRPLLDQPGPARGVPGVPAAAVPDGGETTSVRVLSTSGLQRPTSLVWALPTDVSRICCSCTTHPFLSSPGDAHAAVRPHLQAPQHSAAAGAGLSRGAQRARAHDDPLLEGQGAGPRQPSGSRQAEQLKIPGKAVLTRAVSGDNGIAAFFVA